MSLPDTIKNILHEGIAIPAHPLALTAERDFDEAIQRRLTRYYLASGAGGIAVAVHSTQFEIREPQVNLLEKVLYTAADEVEKSGKEQFVKVAGICGPTDQAVSEARLAKRYGYHLGLLSMGGLNTLTEEALIERAKAVAEIVPVFGFYLQPAVGGRILSFEFWRKFAAIPNVQAIKIAAFNRYQTLDVVRAVCSSERADEIALYTGNDDNIIADLLTTYQFNINGRLVQKDFRGGLLGHWAVWTHKAARLLDAIKAYKSGDQAGLGDWLTKNIQVTDMNAAIFDPVNRFHGCIPGIHEVLRRQGLLKGTWCLNPNEVLSPGQADEITRVTRAYPDLVDDDFVTTFLQQDRG
ncbi:dihydrodipicolinate synthase family protein [Niabella sp. CC-SYL272]|uniref:dihydrodipicolinate synthase family protein n=1 Tax=Niabella agricola TaxID=2891571 RepID=UPI001F456BB9|nr:dihydrodipicolinate synthase family protein [Niabella agricola]MCF3108756.1 dihydrodipicolinate synthase family protein [Niabella agricola]